MQFCDESVRELHFTTDGLPVIGDNNSPDFDELALENLDFHTEDPAHTRARHGFYGGDFVSGEDLWDGRPSAEDILCDISDALFEIECSDEDDNITVDTLELEAEEIEAEEWIARALRLRSLAEMEIVQRYGVSPEWLATVEEGELGVNTLALIAEAAKAAKALGIDWSVIEEATRPTEMMELVSKLQTQAQELRRAKAQAERDAARKPAPSSKGKGKRR
ncbi:hypothetical protein CO174_01865, partial [Candidatus Uhrbacteria bacterium CG_4_9_14_3_um_filter_50_9]